MPARALVHIDTLLTEVAAGYTNQDYIADRVLPIIPVSKETGKIGKYGLEHYRLDFGPRAPRSKAARLEWQADTALSFEAVEYCLETPVDDREIPYYDSPFDAKADATLTLKEKLLLKREKVVATLMTTSGNFGSTTSGSAWGTPASGTPVTDIRTAIAAIVARTGVSPANLYGSCSFSIWNKLIQCTEVKNLYLNTLQGAAAPANLQPAMIAQAIGLNDIYVGTAVENTVNEGATASFSYCWGTTTFAVFVKVSRPSLRSPGFGGILTPTVPGFNGVDVVADEYRDESIKSDIIRVQAMWDELVVNSALGQLITGIS